MCERQEDLTPGDTWDPEEREDWRLTVDTQAAYLHKLLNCQ